MARPHARNSPRKSRQVGNGCLLDITGDHVSGLAWRSRAARVIGSIVQYLFAPDGPEAVIEKMAAASTRIVFLTITEGGYNISGITGEFDAANPDVVRDLEQGAVPPDNVRPGHRGAEPTQEARPGPVHRHVVRQLAGQRSPCPSGSTCFRVKNLGDRALPFGLLDDERAPGQGDTGPGVEARASCQPCGPGWRTDQPTRPGTPAESSCALRSLPPPRQVVPYRTATALACAAGLALLTVRAAEGAAKMNRCRETCR
jgi:hypothetical protein